MRPEPGLLHPFDGLPAILGVAGAGQRRTACPRCGGRHVQRWGSFSGRRRYRCTGCRRTFSDLTATPAAYTKKLALWAPYGRCLAHGMSVRRAAARVRIHPSTAFRWRHAILDGLRAADRERLAGWVELHSLRFAYSEKGRRNVRAPRKRAIEHGLWTGLEAVNVLVACDRRGRAVTAVTGLSSVWLIACAALDTALAQRLHGRPIVTARQPKHGPAARFARLRGLPFHSARGRSTDPVGRHAHVRTALAYGQRLKDWLRRFCGVATRYLPNYLVWHRAVDVRWRLAHLPARRSSGQAPGATQRPTPGQG